MLNQWAGWGNSVEPKLVGKRLSPGGRKVIINDGQLERKAGRREMERGRCD